MAGRTRAGTRSEGAVRFSLSCPRAALLHWHLPAAPPGSVSRRPVLPAARLSCHGDTQRHVGKAARTSEPGRAPGVHLFPPPRPPREGAAVLQSPSPQGHSRSI